MQIPISAANWFPLSANYNYDENLSFKPTLIQWRDGYKGIHHPLFENARDVSSNKDTIFYLTTAKSLFDFVQENSNGVAYLGSYIALSLNGCYVTSSSTNIFLSATPLTDKSFFRLMVNTDNTYSLMQGESKYITIAPYTPHNITLENRLENEEADRQKFNLYSPDNERVYFTTSFENRYTSYESGKVERFLSISPKTCALRAVGMIADDDYTRSNNYIFDIIGYDLVFTLDGLNRDQTWIQYYNQLDNKQNNKNVELMETRCISGVDISRLVDLPYFTKIEINGDRGKMDINLANLKNSMTPEYEYNIRANQPLEK